MRIQNALLLYDVVMKPNIIRFEICDKYVQGVYLENKQSIILCSNTLFNKKEFDDAVKRHLIRLYDYERSENYDCENCKHLACSEVRAAIFSHKCYG